MPEEKPEQTEQDPKKELDAAFRRIQALEDKVNSLEGGRAPEEKKPASPNALESTNEGEGAPTPSPETEEEDWL